MNKTTRKTKIIFTIGPATESEETLEAMINEGVDICRINMAHADHDWTRKSLNVYALFAKGLAVTLLS